MEKKLQDYIHFYLGQPCVNSWFPPTHDMYDNGWVFRSMDIDSKKPYRLDSGESYTWTADIKPRLRPLSDMKNADALKMYEQLFDEEAYRGRSEEFKINFVVLQVDLRGGPMKPEAVAWLLREGFDLFGLISAGLAIDRTKAQPESKEGER